MAIIKKMKRLLVTLTILLIHLASFGQHDLGLKVNGGLSYFSTKAKSTQPITQKFYFMASGQGGLFYNLHIHNKFLFGTEIVFMQIQGKELLKFELTDQYGNPTGQYSTNNIWRNISYLGIPIYFGYNYKKLNVNLGIQANYTLASNGHDKGQATFNGSVMTWSNHYDKLVIDSYDLGARGGILFRLSDKFSFEANYYYGFNNIVNKYLSKLWTWKVQQMTIGLRYKYISMGGHQDDNKKE